MRAHVNRLSFYTCALEMSVRTGRGDEEVAFRARGERAPILQTNPWLDLRRPRDPGRAEKYRRRPVPPPGSTSPELVEVLSTDHEELMDQFVAGEKPFDGEELRCLGQPLLLFPPIRTPAEHFSGSSA
jgi:hypothetical protein